MNFSFLKYFRRRRDILGMCCVEIQSPINYSLLRVKKDAVIRIGSDSIVETQIAFEREGAILEVGDRTFLGGGLLTIANQVSIGNDVLISWGVTITDHNSHSIRFSERASDVLSWKRGVKEWSSVKIGKVKIEDKAWIGFNAIILKNVTVGEGAIVGAASVVTKDIPAWSIAAGNPAKVIREIPLEER